MKQAILCTWASVILFWFCPTAIAQTPTAQKAAENVEAESTPISVILLQTKLPKLSKERVSELVSKAWPVDSAKRIVVENANPASPERRDPGFVIFVSGDVHVLVTLSAQPFVAEADIEQVSDIRSKKMLWEHRASISLRLEGKDLSDVTPLVPQLTKLAAEFVDANTLGIIVPSEEILLPRSSDLQALLRDKDPVAALVRAANVPVLNSADDDPKMKAAVQEARKSWTQFEKAFTKRAANTESFNVKFPFPAKDRQEFMWVEVTSIKDNMVIGKLGNDPVWATNLKIGDEVTMKISELADWMYLQDGEMVGGFSVKVLLEKSKSQSAK